MDLINLDEENGAVALLVLFLLGGGFWFISSVDLCGIFVVFLGAVLFFGAMLVAGENSDFNAVHNEW